MSTRRDCPLSNVRLCVVADIDRNGFQALFLGEAEQAELVAQVYAHQATALG